MIWYYFESMHKLMVPWTFFKPKNVGFFNITVLSFLWIDKYFAPRLALTYILWCLLYIRGTGVIRL